MALSQRLGHFSIDDCVVYELRVGAFIEVGTFDAAIERLDRLASLSVTAIALMPLDELPEG